MPSCLKTPTSPDPTHVEAAHAEPSLSRALVSVVFVPSPETRAPPGMPPPDDGRDEVLLNYTEHNPAGKSTVLLVHGACTTGQNWDLVVPHLADAYHLLVPDLPAHGQSRNVTPFSTEYASRLLERLVRKHAHDRRAHVVGHSLGAIVAIDFIATYPEVVNTAFVSGFAKYSATKTSPLFPYGFWADGRSQKLVPRPVKEWLMDGTDLGDSPPCSLQLCREIAAAMFGKWPRPWPARTLIVAAGKGGILPSSDRVEDTRKLMEIGKEKNEQTRAVTHPLMRHPWNRQDPPLFAQTARAWFEGKELPEGFQNV